MIALPLLAGCGGAASFRPVALSDVWSTANPRVLVIGEAEDTFGPNTCGYTYRLSISGDAHRLRLALLQRPNRLPQGASCALAATYLMRRVRLPAAYSGQPVVDAATGKPVPVKAPDDQLRHRRSLGPIPFAPRGGFSARP